MVLKRLGFPTSQFKTIVLSVQAYNYVGHWHLKHFLTALNEACEDMGTTELEKWDNHLMGETLVLDMTRDVWTFPQSPQYVNIQLQHMRLQMHH